MDRVDRDNFRLPAGPPAGERAAGSRGGKGHAVKGTQQRTRTHMHKALHQALPAMEPTHA